MAFYLYLTSPSFHFSPRRALAPLHKQHHILINFPITKPLENNVLMKFKRDYYHFNAMQKYAKPQRTFDEDKMFLRNTKRDTKGTLKCSLVA
jgi:hypothetical protein